MLFPEEHTHVHGRISREVESATVNCSSPWQGPGPLLAPSEPPLAAWPPHRRMLTCAAPWQQQRLSASSRRVFSTSTRGRMPRRLRTRWCRPSRRWLRRRRRPECFDGSQRASFVVYCVCYAGLVLEYNVVWWSSSTVSAAAVSSSTIVSWRKDRVAAPSNESAP